MFIYSQTFLLIPAFSEFFQFCSFLSLILFNSSFFHVYSLLFNQAEFIVRNIKCLREIYKD